MNYLVIDLEMCKVPRDYRSKRYKYILFASEDDYYEYMND